MIFNIDTYGSRIDIIADDGTQLTYAELVERVRQRLSIVENREGHSSFLLMQNRLAAELMSEDILNNL